METRLALHSLGFLVIPTVTRSPTNANATWNMPEAAVVGSYGNQLQRAIESWDVPDVVFLLPCRIQALTNSRSGKFVRTYLDSRIA